MLSLHPASSSIDVNRTIRQLDREPGPDLPWVMTNMVASADGAIAVDATSGALGGDGDRELFLALRSVADVILVGSSTVRAERYRPPQLNEQLVAARLDAGQSPLPALAIVSNTLRFDLDIPVLADTDYRPTIVTSERSPLEQRNMLADKARLVFAGQNNVDLRFFLRQLRSEGVERVLCEGGPSLNNQLVNHQLIDEWNMTISPTLVGGDSLRAAQGKTTPQHPTGLALSHIWRHKQEIFCRWLRCP